jgi:hypothetical protein
MIGCIINRKLLKITRVYFASLPEGPQQLHLLCVGRLP